MSAGFYSMARLCCYAELVNLSANKEKEGDWSWNLVGLLQGLEGMNKCQI